MNINDRELLARTLQAEAGNQGFGGMIAAGSVIMNRVGAGGFGSNIRDVILAPGQFSAWNKRRKPDGSFIYAGGKQGQNMDFTPNAEAYKAADALLSGQYEDMTGGATHYFNPDLSQPSWGQGGNWKRIGDHVFGRADAGRQKGTQAMDRQQPSAQQMQQMQQQQPRQGGLMGFLRDPRNRQVFSALSRSRAGQALGKIADADFEIQQEQSRGNRTAQWLRTQPDGERYAQAIESGMNAKTVYAQYMSDKKADSDPNVQSRQMLPDNSGSVVTMRDGTQFVLTSGGQRLTGAEADAFVQKAQQAYTKQQQEIFTARRSGTLDANIQLGGQAAQTKAEGERKVKWIDEVRSERKNIMSTISGYDMALRALDQGASTGRVAKMLPTIKAQTQLLETAKQQLGLDVIGSVTFGALSQGELDLAMDTGLPSDSLGPVELRKWIMERKEAKEKAAAALLDTAEYLSDPNTTYESYYKRIREAGSAGGAASPAATQSDNPLDLDL